MKPHILGAFAACLVLAACQSNSDPASPSPSPVVPPLAGPASPAPASGPEAACVAKLAATNNTPASAISVSSKEETVGGYLIMLEVTGNAPWRCTVDDAGIATVETTVDEEA